MSRSPAAAAATAVPSLATWDGQRIAPRTSLRSGTFDGVHVGHRAILGRLTRRAAERRLPSLLVTFDPHPIEVVNPSAAPLLLTSTGEKLEAIAECGLDYAVVLPFTRRLAALDPS